MKLLVHTNYGQETNLVSEQASVLLVSSTIRTLDWTGFHQVVLEQENGDWLEVSGSLVDDGLSAMYQQGEDQFVSDGAPETIDQLIEIALTYLNDIDMMQKKYAWV